MEAKSLGTIVITITLDVNPLKNVFHHTAPCSYMLTSEQTRSITSFHHASFYQIPRKAKVGIAGVKSLVRSVVYLVALLQFGYFNK